MDFKYRELRGRIIARYDTIRKFADALGISEQSVSIKINGKRQFKQVDILKWCELLDIPVEECHIYFFA